MSKSSGKVDKRKSGQRTDFLSGPITSAEHGVLARAADAADYSVCGRLADKFGIAYINPYKYFKGEHRVPLDRAEDVGAELGIDPARISTAYRIDRERLSRESQEVHEQREFEVLQRAIKRFPGTLGDMCSDLASELSANKNRIRLWLTGHQEVPHSFAPPLAAYLEVHPAAISLQYLALHRFPRPANEDPAAPIPTGPYTEGEWMAERPADPEYRPLKVRANTKSPSPSHPVPSDKTQCDRLFTPDQASSGVQAWPDAAIDITARAVGLTLKTNTAAAMALMRDLLLTAGQEVYDKVSAKLVV